MSENNNKNRFFKMADIYDKLAQYLVPKYDYLQEEVIDLLPFNINRQYNVIDLGAGSGIFLERFLKKYPNVKCFWIDYSDDFLNVAKNRLNKYNKRINFIISPIEEDWTKLIHEKVHLITSMSAIHHLETQEKKELYKRCYDLLEETGWFFNIDEMKTLNFDAYKSSLERWYKHGEEIKKKIPNHLLSSYKLLKNQFDNWKIRNLDNIEKPKTKGDDIHETFIDQINWLNEIGYKNVDLFIKHHLWCVIGGQKLN